MYLGFDYVAKTWSKSIVKAREEYGHFKQFHFLISRVYQKETVLAKNMK